MLALAGVHVPLLQTRLGTVPLSGPDLAVALTPGIAGWCIALLVRGCRGPTTSRPSSLHRVPGGRKHGWDKEGVAP